MQQRNETIDKFRVVFFPLFSALGRRRNVLFRCRLSITQNCGLAVFWRWLRSDVHTGMNSAEIQSVGCHSCPCFVARAATLLRGLGFEELQAEQRQQAHNGKGTRSRQSSTHTHIYTHIYTYSHTHTHHRCQASCSSPEHPCPSRTRRYFSELCGLALWPALCLGFVLLLSFSCPLAHQPWAH